MKKSSKTQMRFYYISAILFNGLFALIVIQYAEMFKLFFDNAQSGKTTGYLTNAVLLLFLIACQTVFHYIASMSTNKVYLIHKKRLQNDFFSSVMQKDIKHIGDFSTGKLQNVIMNDIDAIAQLVSFTYVKAIHIIIKTILFIGYLFSIDVLLGLVSLLISPVLLVFSISFSGIIRKSSSEFSKREANLNAKYNEFFQYNLFFKLFDSKDYLDTQVEKEIFKYNKVAKQAFKISTFFSELSSAVAQAAGIIVLAVGAYMISTNSISTGDLVAFMHIQNQVIYPLVSLNSLYAVYQNSKGKRDIIDEILNLPTQNNKIELVDNLNSLLVAENISVSLKDNEIFTGINFSIEKNELVLIVGENGVGKSTLLNTLFGLYTPDNGVVNYCSSLGTNINNQVFEYCIQQNNLIEGTLRENLCLDVSTEDSALLKICNDFNLLDDFSDGLNSCIQFNGGNISGGQSRKISLMRALLSKKPIIILDEPFASLDKFTTQVLVDMIAELKKTKTIIVISHSNELFDIVDKILYFNADEIISSTLEDLKRNNQGFNELINE